MAFKGDVPMAQLATLVDSMRTDLFERDLRASQRKALVDWRDKEDRPGLHFRFTKDGAKHWRFSLRDFRYAQRLQYNGQRQQERAPGVSSPATSGIRKGALPDYVYTGRFRDSLYARKPRKVKGTNEIKTSLSIFGGALNAFGHHHGWSYERVTRESTQVIREAHTRRGRRGQPVKVRSYVQRGTKLRIQRTRSPLSYRDEWAIRNEERAWVSARSDALFLERFRKLRLRPDGSLKSAASIGATPLENA